MSQGDGLVDVVRGHGGADRGIFDAFFDAFDDVTGVEFLGC